MIVGIIQESLAYFERHTEKKKGQAWLAAPPPLSHGRILRGGKNKKNFFFFHTLPLVFQNGPQPRRDPNKTNPFQDTHLVGGGILQKTLGTCVTCHLWMIFFFSSERRDRVHGGGASERARVCVVHSTFFLFFPSSSSSSPSSPFPKRRQKWAEPPIHLPAIPKHKKKKKINHRYFTHKKKT